MTCFVLIRHGTTDHTGHTLSGRLQEVELNERGREEAAELPRRLASLPPDLLCCSPLMRCRQTATPLAETFRLNLRLMPELEEVDYGQWEGKAWAALTDDPLWQRYNQQRSLCRIPDGELSLELQLRMMKALETLHREAPDATVAIVSHGDPIRVVLAYCLGIPLDLMHRLQVSTASISILELHEGGLQVHCINHRSPLVLRRGFI